MLGLFSVQEWFSKPLTGLKGNVELENRKRESTQSIPLSGILYIGLLSLERVMNSRLVTTVIL